MTLSNLDKQLLTYRNEASIARWTGAWIAANAFDILTTGVGIFMLGQREINPFANAFGWPFMLVLKVIVTILLPFTAVGIVYAVNRWRRPLPDFDVAVRNLIRLAAVLIWLAVIWNSAQIALELGGL